MKKLLSTLFMSAIMLTPFAVPVYAAENVESTASIKLTAGELTLDPEGENYPGIEGQDMNFGTHEISVENTTYDTVDNKKVGLQVSDGRGQEKAAWKVSVSASKFQDADGKESLKGYKLVLDPVTDSIKGPESPNNKPEQQKVTLFAETEETIFNSNSANGSPGRWGANWTPTLEVMGGSATTSDHTATVTWTVESAL